MVNLSIIIGNLGKDAELKRMENGRDLCTFRVATDESYTDKTGKKHEHVEWFGVDLFGPLGPALHRHLRKGAQVYVEGKMRSRKYQTKEGQEVTHWAIRAETVRLMGRAPSDAKDTGGDNSFDFGDVP